MRGTSYALLTMATIGVLLTGCSNMSNRDQRMLSGGAIGAGVGAAGAAVTGGCVTCGAIIGGGVGTAAGAIYDNKH